ncbi:MAG: 2-oxoacid:acceptor oxidoreductase family protein [Chloroflexota bacterium]
MNGTIEIRWHGRGGQGAVTSSELVSYAAINEGKYALSFPSFGPERRGAPVLAFNRVGEEHIRIRAEVTEPDIVVVLDPGLLRVVNVASGLKPGGIIIVNTRKSAQQLRDEFGFDCTLGTVNATRIAWDILKVPITNTAMVGALVKGKEVVKLDSLIEPVKDRFGRIGDINVEAMKKAYEETVVSEVA